MNWISELCDLYEKNKESILPPGHTTVTAQITVTIDGEGNFLGAERVDPDNKITVIPVTEKSASRTSGQEPHPFCDNLKYLAGDYMDYYDQKKNKDYTEYHQSYMQNLYRWHTSAYTHDKVDALYRYLKKAALMRDLAAAGVLVLNENGKAAETEKIQNIPQADAFVRFRIESGQAVTEEMLSDNTGKYRPECWLDKTLQDSFAKYYLSLEGEYGISYLTGEIQRTSWLHAKKVRNEGDGAKLISSNDENGLTFRGRFATKEEAFQIGYEDSQKIHNALKWIIRKQGYGWEGLCVVVWESDLKPLPDIRGDSDEISTAYEEDIWGNPESEEEYLGTDEAGAERFRRAMRGYGGLFHNRSRTVLLAFDAATTGRLAMVENKTFDSSNFVENIRLWHENCSWQHQKFKNKKLFTYTGMAGTEELTELLFGTEQDGWITLKGKTKMYAEVYQRLLPCITQRRDVPQDLVDLAVRKASSPISYQEKYNWDRVLSLACSLVKKKRLERNEKEEWSVALDKNCTKRDYLYGRLLAVADRIEYLTYPRDEKNARWQTNAKRYMSAFSQRPFQTWQVIEEKLEPYLKKLKPGSYVHYTRLLDEITDSFNSIEEYQCNDRLNGLYLLGFHSQACEMRTSAEKENNSEEEEN